MLPKKRKRKKNGKKERKEKERLLKKHGEVACQGRKSP
jgi:hypothetical protein